MTINDLHFQVKSQETGFTASRQRSRRLLNFAKLESGKKGQGQKNVHSVPFLSDKVLNSIHHEIYISMRSDSLTPEWPLHMKAHTRTEDQKMKRTDRQTRQFKRYLFRLSRALARCKTRHNRKQLDLNRCPWQLPPNIIHREVENTQLYAVQSLLASVCIGQRHCQDEGYNLNFIGHSVSILRIGQLVLPSLGH